MCRNSQKALNAQTEVGQRLRGCDKTLGTIASELGWHRNTLDSYFPANRDTPPTKLPMDKLWDILECAGFPAELKELLAPDGIVYVRIPNGADHDDVAAGCEAFLASFRKAVHPESEGGREIVGSEVAELNAARAAIGGEA